MQHYFSKQKKKICANDWQPKGDCESTNENLRVKQPALTLFCVLTLCSLVWA